MIFTRWRLLISSLLHHVVLLAAILIFLWAVFLSILRVTFIFLPQHEAMIANILSPLIGAPVTFNKMEADWHRLSPEFVLSEVKVWGDHHQVLMSVPEVSIRIDLLSSLLHRQAEIGLLRIHGWKLHIYQDANDHWQVAGIEALNMSTTPGNEEVDFSDFINTMELIHHLQLSQNDIILQPAHHPEIKLINMNLDWYSNEHHLTLYGNTSLQGPSHTRLRFAAHLQGTKVDQLTGDVYVKLLPTELRPWLLEKSWKNFVWEEGSVGGEIWGSWQKDHWENVATDLTLNDLNLHQMNQANPWSFNAQKINVMAEGQFSPQRNQVKFALKSDTGKAILGHIFRSAMPYEKLDFVGEWTKDAAGNQALQVQPIHLVTSDADTWSWLKIHWSKTLEPMMELISKAHLNDLQHVSHNLPAGVMPKGVVDWLDRAVLDGDASEAEMLWRGPLAHFPFHDQSGTMQIYGKVNHVTLDYAPDWPSIHELDADLYFTSHGMHIVAEQGWMNQLSLANAVVDIPEFKGGAHLLIHDEFNGALENAWDVLNHSPLKNRLSFLVGQMNAEGPFHLNVSMDLPLASPEAVKYQGSVDLKQDQLNLLTLPIALAEVSGQVNFDAAHVQGKNLEANWLGEPWHLQLSTVKQKTQLDFSGTAPLGDWIKQNFQYASGWAEGKTAVVGKMLFSPHAFNLSLNSSLQGLVLHSPLGQEKLAETAAPFHLQLSQAEDAPLDLNATLGLPNAPIKLQSQHGIWTINTKNLVGNIIAPSMQKNVWSLNFSLANLSQLKNLNTSSMSMNHLPAMDIHASKITLPSGMFLNSLQVQLRPKSDGFIAIKNLILNHPAFQITAQGSQGAGVSRLSGQLTAKDFESAAKILGLPNLAVAQNMAVNFDFSWPGSVWDFDRKILAGHLKITTGAGVFKDVSDQTISKINLGKMLDFLSVSELPSHLTSKFNDMTQKGFPFDQVNGEMDVAPNQVNQLNIKITGPVANVALNGCVNTADENLNLIAEVNPKLTGSLPLLATLAGGPILGAVGFVANEILSPAVGKISASYYAVTGNEKNPKTDKVNRLQADQLLKACPI